jgi:DNA-binding transcriptional LysR family regulator
MAFEACIRHGSVTRAAEELSLAQPTVSGHLRKLTDTVGEPIVAHRCGRMEPTAAGQRLAALCDEIYAALDRFELSREDEALSSGDGPAHEEDPDAGGGARGDGGLRVDGGEEWLEGGDRDRR